MKSKLIVSIICILMIFTYLILPVSANSAQQHKANKKDKPRINLRGFSFLKLNKKEKSSTLCTALVFYYSLINASAIWIAFVAAPFLTWSPQHQSVIALSNTRSSLILPT